MSRPKLRKLMLINGGDNGNFLSDNREGIDRLWIQLRREAKEAYFEAPMLAPLFVDSIINQPSFESAAFHRISARLTNSVVGLGIIIDAFNRAYEAHPSILDALYRDLEAVFDSDPACSRIIEPFLYFKGFHALQTHRLSHWLWNNGEKDFALYLQSRSSELFQTDIHPAAKFGSGIFIDHATGLVVGETTVVEDDVSLLQDVTLGGTGKQAGDRHPKIRKGTRIGAGAKILGNVEVGAFSCIAAGSIVLEDVPAGATVVGIPAKVIKISDGYESDDLRDTILASGGACLLDYSI